MKAVFEKKENISPEDPLVVVQSSSLEGKTKVLLDSLQHYDETPANRIPIKVEDRILLLKVDEIILADIQKTTLLIYSGSQVYQTTETLSHFQRRLGRTNFIQVSKHAVMNIDHLQSLSDSFSGNMMAKLSNGVKTSVSRRYIKYLLDYLGI